MNANAQVRQLSSVSSTSSVSTRSAIANLRKDAEMVSLISVASRRQREQAQSDQNSDLLSPYDPSWLVRLGQENYPQAFWLHAALGNCTKHLKPSPHYIFFINPNPQNSEWQYERSIILTCLEKGLLVVDILKDTRVGGIEFYAGKEMGY